MVRVFVIGVTPYTRGLNMLAGSSTISAPTLTLPFVTVAVDVDVGGA
jgi:hypothetical protein